MSEGSAGKPAARVSGDDVRATRTVQEFYEQYPFPGARPMERDGLVLLRRLACTLASQQRTSGADRLRLLDAGCGTGNTLAATARLFPEVDCLGIDLSGPSLDIAARSVQAAELDNVRLRSWLLTWPDLPEAPFDVILCLGVLHHTADMAPVLVNLRGWLRGADSRLYLWIYGRHGRYRHARNCELLRMLQAAAPTEDPVALARDFMLHAKDGMPVEDLLGPAGNAKELRQVLDDHAWVADQFLHPVEHLLTMQELLRLVAAAGLEIRDWLVVGVEPVRHLASPELRRRFDALAPDQRLCALDLLLKPDRYFVELAWTAASGSPRP